VLPDDLASPGQQLSPLTLNSHAGADGEEHLIECRGTLFRVHVDEGGIQAPAVLLPFDQFFEIRATAAIRLWRGLTGRNPGPNPAALSKARRDRLVLALRAIDGSQEHASYREIARAVFSFDNAPERDWKSHDLRDRTIRLVRFGLGMMRTGYRRLLHYPYRRRS
jgi:hypothetical protein